MTRHQVEFGFLNLGHFLDHLVILVFATAAALTLIGEWGMSYAELIPYATPAFVAFGVGAVPAGWLADKWSRPGMMVVFFIGLGGAALLTSLAETPFQIGAGLFLVGVFSAIYHPVGLAMVVEGRERTGVALAVNGVFGNLGVASAALLTGVLIDTAGWRFAFIVPGVLSIATGVAYLVFLRAGRAAAGAAKTRPARTGAAPISIDRAVLVRVFSVVIATTALGGLVFQSTTFALPKILDERLGALADSATGVGGYAFAVFALAAFAQLVVGHLVDRHSVRTVFAVVAAAQLLGFVAIIELTGAAALIVSLGFMLAVFGQIPINDVLIGRMTRSEWRSRIFALRYIVTFSVSATAVPLIAWLHAGWGFGSLFAVMAVAAGAILAAVLTLPRSGALIARTAAPA